MITEVSTNRYYIGVRTSSTPPEIDLGKHYFSSSSDIEFRKNQKSNPSDYIYDIIGEFDNRDDAVDFEAQMHTMYDVAYNDNFINRHNSSSVMYDMTGRVVVKDADGNTYNISVNDHRYISGELVHHSKGYDRSYCIDVMKNRWKDDYNAMMAMCHNKESEAKRSLSIKHWIKNNQEAHMERMMKINTNPEKIRKTAEKHTGMKRTEENKANMSDARNNLLQSSSPEEFARLTGKGLVTVTNIIDYTNRRASKDYILQENELFGRISYPKLPLKKSATITNILTWEERVAPAGYILQPTERKGNKKRVRKAINEGKMI